MTSQLPHTYKETRLESNKEIAKRGATFVHNATNGLNGLPLLKAFAASESPAGSLPPWPRPEFAQTTLDQTLL